MLPLTKQITDATTSGSSDTTRKKRFDERMEKLMIQAYTTPETSAAAAISATAAHFTPVSLAVFRKAAAVDPPGGENLGEPQRDRVLYLDLQDRPALRQERDAVERAVEREILHAVARVFIDRQTQIAVRLVISRAVIDDETARRERVVMAAEGADLAEDLSLAKFLAACEKALHAADRALYAALVDRVEGLALELEENRRVAARQPVGAQAQFFLEDRLFQTLADQPAVRRVVVERDDRGQPEGVRHHMPDEPCAEIRRLLRVQQIFYLVPLHHGDGVGNGLCHGLLLPAPLGNAARCSFSVHRIQGKTKKYFKGKVFLWTKRGETCYDRHAKKGESYEPRRERKQTPV